MAQLIIELLLLKLAQALDAVDSNLVPKEIG